jgi:hypothetical protein
MKTAPAVPSATRATRLAAVVIVTIALMASPARAEFHGSDSLAAWSPKWAELFQGSRRNSLIFRNSRLEYLNKSYKPAYLRWTPNRGNYDQDWFAQVDVHLKGNYDGIGIGVTNYDNRDYGYVISIDGSSEFDEYRGFKVWTLKGFDNQYSLSSAIRGSLRIRFDSKAKTLTGSWKTPYSWHQFKPFDISHWKMDDTSRFNAVLVGGSFYEDDDDNSNYPNCPDHDDDDDPPSKSYSNAYFTNFKCGPTVPEIVVEQPEFTGIKDGCGKRSFGTAAVGGKGITRTFTIRNNGTANLEILSITSAGPHAGDFHLSVPSKIRIEPTATATFIVIFKPKAAGTRRASLEIRCNDTNESPFNIKLAGQGAELMTPSERR